METQPRAASVLSVVLAFSVLICILPITGCRTRVGYTVGGMVSGLAGSGLVLQDNGGKNLTVMANGSFTFTATLTRGNA